VSAAQPPSPVFYYDLGSPECYLAAERIMGALPVVPEWEPVLATELSGVNGADGSRASVCTLSAEEQAALAARASRLGLQPFR
jgi:hypothetical protein